MNDHSICVATLCIFLIHLKLEIASAILALSELKNNSYETKIQGSHWTEHVQL